MHDSYIFLYLAKLFPEKVMSILTDYCLQYGRILVAAAMLVDDVTRSNVTMTHDLVCT